MNPNRENSTRKLPVLSTAIVAGVALGTLAFVRPDATVALDRPGPMTASATVEHHAAAALEWNAVARDVVTRAKPSQHGAMRLFAYLTLAQHRAEVEVRSAVVDDMASAIDGAVAGASRAVLAALFPEQGEPAEAAWKASRERAADHLADFNQGAAIGSRMAAEVIERARGDGFAAAWTGTIPQDPGLWKSLMTPPRPPALPQVGAMRTFFMESGSQFRPAPPPRLDSQAFAMDLAEVRSHAMVPTKESTEIARFWEMTTGSMAAGYWNEVATGLIAREGRPMAEALRLLAVMNMAVMDAIIACHDAKYVYWTPRPSQADPTIKPVIGVPNHPSYPSNHSCISTAAATVLGHHFPKERRVLLLSAHEAGLSRIYGGIHYRFDVEAGSNIGRDVAALAIRKSGNASFATARPM